MADDIVCQSGIYAITNTVNGKKYIGSAVNIKNRWSVHIAKLDRKTHHNKKLQSAWHKYGKQSFTFSVVELVLDKKLLVSIEQSWMDRLGVVGENGYNLCPTAGSTLGIKLTEEHKAKVGLASKGRVIPKDAIERMRKALTGRKISAEALEKQKRRRHSPETIAKMTGRKHTEEEKEKMRGRKVAIKE